MAHATRRIGAIRHSVDRAFRSLPIAGLLVGSNTVRRLVQRFEDGEFTQSPRQLARHVRSAWSGVVATTGEGFTFTQRTGRGIEIVARRVERVSGQTKLYVDVDVRQRVGQRVGRNGRRQPTNELRMVFEEGQGRLRLLDIEPVHLVGSASEGPAPTRRRFRRPQGRMPNRALQQYLRRQGLRPRVAQHAAAEVPLGLPSLATAGSSYDRLVARLRSVASYNQETGSPNWVGYTIRPGDVSAPGERSPRGWRPDARLSDVRVPSVRDFRGFREVHTGHLVPSGARAGLAGSDRTFRIGPNTMPQHSTNNGGPWSQIEQRTRTLVAAGTNAYVYSGPIHAAAGETVTRGGPDGRVVMPTATWTVVVLRSDSQSWNAATIFAAIIPNDRSAHRRGYEEFQTTAKEIERQTGLRFFSTQREHVAEAMRERRDPL